MDELSLPYDILRFDYKERLTDRFLTTYLHRFELFSKPVALVVLIEIINPWHPSSELGQKILNCLVREFSQSEGQSHLIRFETSLKRVNRDVQEALDQTKSPVSCLAVLLESDQIHSSGIGTAKLGLLRNGKLATVIGSRGTTTDTFAAVTSGDMNENDWLLIANNTFYSNLTDLDGQVWLIDDLAKIGDEISRLDLVDKNQAAAGVLLRFNQTRPTTNQTVLWDEKGTPKINLPRLSWSKVNFGPLAEIISPVIGVANRMWRNVIKLSTNRENDFTKNNSAFKLKLPLPAKRILLLIIFLILIVATILIGNWRSQRNKATDSVETTLLTELRSSPADQLLNGLAQKFTVDGYQSLDETSKTELAALLISQKIFITDLPSPITQAPSDIVALEILNNQPLFIDSQGQIWIYNGSLLTQVSQKTPIANPVSLTAFGPTNIVASDTAGNIWRLDGSSNQPIALTQAGAQINGAKLVDHYQGNLYLISLASRVTSRINNFTGDLASISIYNKAENLLGITNPSDIAINGKVLIADSQGLVVEFARNTSGIVKFQTPTVDGPVKIATSDSAPLTIISSGRVLYLLDSTNTLVSTIFLTSSAKISDIILDPTSPAKFWLASGKDLYSISINLQ
ncbi:MAG: hypothetical protein AAB774_02000 [Patescibacteria group bacterium]